MLARSRNGADGARYVRWRSHGDPGAGDRLPPTRDRLVEDTVAELIEEYLALGDEARTQAVRFGLPEDTAGVERHLQMLRDWMSANLRWSEETPRYGDWVSEVANDVS